MKVIHLARLWDGAIFAFLLEKYMMLLHSAAGKNAFQLQLDRPHLSVRLYDLNYSAADMSMLVF